MSLPPILIILGFIFAILLLSERSRVARQANNGKEAGPTTNPRLPLNGGGHPIGAATSPGLPRSGPCSDASTDAVAQAQPLVPASPARTAPAAGSPTTASLAAPSLEAPFAGTVESPPRAPPFVGAVELPLLAAPCAGAAESPPRGAPFEGAVESPPRAVPFEGAVEPPPSAAPFEGAAESPPSATPLADAAEPPPSAMPLADAVEPPPRAVPFEGAAESPPRTASFPRAALLVGNAELPSPSVKHQFLRRRSGHAPASAHQPAARHAVERTATRSPPASAGAPPLPATPERLPLSDSVGLPLSDSVVALCVFDGALVSGGPGHLGVWGGGGGGGGGGALHSALSGGRAVGLSALSGSRYFVAAGGRSLTVDVWDRHGRQAQLRGHDGNVTCVASLEDVPRFRFATGSIDATIRLWYLEDWGGGAGAGTPTRAPASAAATTAARTNAPSIVSVLRGHKDAVAALAALRAPLLASGSFDKTAIVWDTKKEVAVLSLQHPACVRALAALKGGSLLAAGCDDGVVYVWGVTAEGNAGAAGEARAAAAGKLAKERLARAKDAEDKVKASPADTALRAAAQFLRAAAAARADGVALLKGHKRWVISLAELPGGRLASGSDDGTVRVWNVDARVETWPQACAFVIEHGGPVAALAVKPDGRLAAGTLVVSGDSQHKETLRLWNV